MKNGTKSIGIVRISPTILKRGQVWFEKNEKKIAKESKNFTSWWSNNYFEIEQGQKLQLSILTRKLSDWGYHRATIVRTPGEFTSRGGIIDVFPVNKDSAFRIEYSGNYIENIKKLQNIRIEDQEKTLKDVVVKDVEEAFSKEDKRGKEAKATLKSLRPDTYVVHIDHGIGVYKGMQKDNDGEKIVLQYAESDTLYLPKNIAYKITPYVGFGEPVLTRLGGNIWQKTKKKVKEDLIRAAKELAHIYAKRDLSHRTPYEINHDIESKIDTSFKYPETEDQTKTIDDIKKDLTSDKPMDRVVCGDVGFGKTEIAIRAATYVASAGYQVVLIAPTTVLAHQHYKTFKERLSEASYPLKVEKLTRIESTAKQKEILQKMKDGKCDIVIGTHRLLQKDVEFSNLGMMVIDEEQRFGVKQKEFFKKKRANLDILSLSATPIPRTLSFALSGLRDISIIATPPPGRKPIETIVKKRNSKMIKNAIEKELERNGQVYYLHNKIISLEDTAEKIKEAVPKANIKHMHAKMQEKKLIETIDEFEKGKIDVLVSTTIMENGLDMKNANTLIVEDATRLGLSQAHQIRGRIGRGDKQAFAYFLYPSRKLTEKSKKRLDALREAAFLGGGYEIARRDLEIRGSGNFLGREQSGNIAKVGFNLYCQMLNEAIEEIRRTEGN